MPKELWHKPSAEITHLKTQCESLIESHEEDIEDWYFAHQVKQKVLKENEKLQLHIFYLPFNTTVFL
jgi:hypothetical protein